MPVPAWFEDLLEQELRPCLRLSGDQIAQLYTHYELLERWNEKISLTSVEPGPEMVIRHYCESLFLAAHLPEGALTIADLGSGAGFPGVPVAVTKPGSRVSLIESVHRKAVFLREATRHLTNIDIIAKRAEAVTARFDWVISRAVHSKDVLSNVPRLASQLGLLVGESGLQELKGSPAIAWSEPIRLPWGDRKFLVMGSVSRGTS
ncbi:MAG TPA: 16S rRNA (guanine(527)-N(7))-methyltransferase RsmG [Bryobacteraceae bacterium]|nr:16S rRNA (guanine(527)-N(7))-methyltransferase RsmG [Bryobacteraceae bacterium]